MTSKTVAILSAVATAAALLIVPNVAAATSASVPGPNHFPEVAVAGSGCSAGTSLVVPNEEALSKFGASALFPSNQPGLASRAASIPALNAVIARHPKWLTKLTCQELPVHSSLPGSSADPISNASSSAWFANWSGVWNSWLDTSAYSNFQSVSMSWVVPAAVYPPTSSPEWVSIWPGIGSGNADNDALVQAGSLSNSGPGFAGLGNYSGTSAWFEVYPRENMQEITSMAVSAGDTMNVTVLQENGYANFLVCDSTTNECAYPTEDMTPYFAVGSSSEYIVERPTLNGSFTELSPFGTENISEASGEVVNLGGGYTDFTEGTPGIGSAYALQVDMYNCNYDSPLATSGAANTSGSFAVTFHSTGAVESC